MLAACSTQNKIHAYLTWLEARGLPTLSSQLYCTQEKCVRPVQIHGPRPAKVLVLLGGDALSADEKELLRKILQAMGLAIGSEVCFASGSGLVGAALAPVLAEVRPRAVMSFGKLKIEQLEGGNPLLKRFPSLNEMMENPSLKREAWESAQAIMKALTSLTEAEG